MSAATHLTDPRELAVQERAQALVARGDVVGATRLMDEYLAAHDGDWGSWLYLGGLYGRLGRMAPAVAAYQACARQLEGDGRHERARAALQYALRLTPNDADLQRDIARLEGLARGLREVPPPPPAPSVPERPVRKGAKSSKDITTAVVARRSTSLVAVPQASAPGVVPAQPVSAPRPSRAPVKVLRRSGVQPALPAEAAAPRRAPEPSAEQTYLMLPSMTDLHTDPYIAIFDILDAEAREDRLRSARPRSVRRLETTPMLPRRALR